MLFRVRLRGSDPADLPFRVDLPTYQMRDVDYTAGTALVEVPDADVPIALQSPPPADRIQTPFGQARVRVRPAEAREWHTHLEDRYREHAGEYRPEVA